MLRVTESPRNMKSISIRIRSLPSIAALLGAGLFLVPTSLHGQTYTRYDAQPTGSKVKLEGDSTLHEWSMEGSIIVGFLELDSASKIDTAEKTIAGLSGGKLNARAQASIPIRSIKSGKTSMDSVMQEAMNQKTYPK